MAEKAGYTPVPPQGVPPQAMPQVPSPYSPIRPSLAGPYSVVGCERKVSTLESFLSERLCQAARVGNLRKMKDLLSEGANVNLEDGYKTPLAYAIESRNLEAVKFLVHSGAEIKFSHRPFNPLLYLIKPGNSDIIEFLVSNGADVDIKFDGTTPLHYAALCSSVEFVEYLVRNGADVNARDEEGDTPLHSAVCFGKFENAMYLLNHDADVNAENQCHLTPIHFAVKRRNEEVYNFLRESNVWKRDDVVREESVETVKLLIDQGADLHDIDEEGKTLCHDEVYLKDCRMVVFLSSRCENLHAVNRWNPYYDEEYLRLAKIIRLLLDRGADVSAKNEDGETALDLAKNQLSRVALQNIGKCQRDLL